MRITTLATPATARRRFLLAGGAIAAAIGLGPMDRLLASAGNPRNRRHPGYGPLAPVCDATTGLPLLTLPPGFSYRSFAWVGDPLVGGGMCPDAHDGVGVIGGEGGIVTLVRNNEVVRGSGAFAPAAASYASVCAEIGRAAWRERGCR